jgi:hypothetical protein
MNVPWKPQGLLAFDVILIGSTLLRSVHVHEVPLWALDHLGGACHRCGHFRVLCRYQGNTFRRKPDYISGSAQSHSMKLRTSFEIGLSQSLIRCASEECWEGSLRMNIPRHSLCVPSHPRPQANQVGGWLIAQEPHSQLSPNPSGHLAQAVSH